jgi:hypothetical protein
MTAEEVLADVLAWLDEFYGPVKVYEYPPLDQSSRGMVQYDHSEVEYEVRMDIAAKVRAFFEEDGG